jgi:hypothetical protein
MLGKRKSKLPLAVLVVLLSILACSIRKPPAPTPFKYPTPDFTKTALFAATEITPQGSPTTAGQTTVPGETQVEPTQTLLPSSTTQPTRTSTWTFTPSHTPLPTNTPVPSNTPLPTKTFTASPTVSYKGPDKRDGPQIKAFFFTAAPTINGDLWDWSFPVNQIDKVVYGEGKHENGQDCSGLIMFGWDANYLYVAGWVKDDVYAQGASLEHIFKGDSLEILLDSKVSHDFYLDELSLDDYQLGISPGKPSLGTSPEAYLWYPRGKAGRISEVQMVAIATGDGYQFELAVPWDVFDIEPQVNDHYGFGFSISDNDNPAKNVQQSMVSNLPDRVFTHPMTWGDLVLKK